MKKKNNKNNVKSKFIPNLELRLVTNRTLKHQQIKLLINDKIEYSKSNGIFLTSPKVQNKDLKGELKDLYYSEYRGGLALYITGEKNNYVNLIYRGEKNYKLKAIEEHSKKDIYGIHESNEGNLFYIRTSSEGILKTIKKINKEVLEEEGNFINIMLPSNKMKIKKEKSTGDLYLEKPITLKEKIMYIIDELKFLPKPRKKLFTLEGLKYEKPTDINTWH